MIIPAWHIGVLALLYALEFAWRAWKQPEKRYLSIGKMFGRLILAGAYFYIECAALTPPQAQVLVRWSLLFYLLTDIINRKISNGHR